jgi:hypothetical protein
MSDIVESQEALIEAQRGDIERLIGVVSDVLAALTENRRPNASESVTIKRAGIGDKPTTIDVSAVVQDGETLADARARAQVEYEKAAARFPLPNGYAHAAPLGDEGNPRTPPTLEQQLAGSLPDGAK